MPRPRSDAPAYRYHISGQARVTLDGKDFFLGEFDTPQSKAKYYALLAEYNANGKRMPKDTATHQAEAPITVQCVTAEYREHIEVKYANNEAHRNNLKNLCTLLEDEYGDSPAADFGPRKLSELRNLFVASGNNRRYANMQTSSIRNIFKHAVSRELVDVNVLIRLQTLEPLRRGQTTAPEPIPRQPVDPKTVAATLPFLSPMVSTMVRLQLTTGMRPSEVCNIRPMDIDRTDPQVWMYRPKNHKTAHHGRTKAVPILGDARKSIEPWMDRDADRFLFSPKEARQWHLDRRRQNRTTPLNCGCGPGDNRKSNPKRSPGDRYNKDSYRRAVQRAAMQAGVPTWTPYQLRYTAATKVRNALGIEAAQALLGHSRANMTEHYAKLDESKSIAAARALEQGLSDS